MELVFANDQFSSNLKAIRDAFPFAYNANHGVGTLICAAENKSINVFDIQESRKILKQNAGIFSEFRDHMEIPLSIKMALSGDPQGYFDGISRINDKLGEDFIFGSVGRVLAAITIYEDCPPEEVDDVIAKTLQIYNKMKAEHPFLTSQYDMNFAALMAMDGADIDERLADMEACYNIITERFTFSRDAVQSVCQILSLSNDEPVNKSVRFNEYYDEMKRAHRAIWAGPQLSILGILTNLDAPVSEVVEKASQYEEYLRGQKGMGTFSMDAQERRMLAAALTTIDYLSTSNHAQTVSVSATISMIVDFEIMLMILIMSDIVASASSSLF